MPRDRHENRPAGWTKLGHEVQSVPEDHDSLPHQAVTRTGLCDQFTSKLLADVGATSELARQPKNMRTKQERQPFQRVAERIPCGPNGEYVNKYNGRLRTYHVEGNQVLVRFFDDAPLATRDEVTARLGLSEVHSSDNPLSVGVYERSLDSALTVERLASLLNRDPDVFEAMPLLEDDLGYPQYFIAGEFTVAK